MKVSELKRKILNDNFNEIFSKLYFNVQAAKKRYSGACDAYIKLFGDNDNARVFSAPGRTEVGGNHTDHQHGRVLTGSVDLDVIAIACPSYNNFATVKSEGFAQDCIDLSKLDINFDETGRAASLIRGVLSFFNQFGYKIGGFNAYTTSNVLKGSGLSSSAAFEVLLGNILSGLFNGGSVSKVDIAKISQKAEREYFGKPCGLLDQMASSLGGFTAIDFKDPDDIKIEQVDFDLAKEGFSLCVVNTGGSHANLTQDYADITIECKNISNYFGKEVLRDVNPEDFYDKIPLLRGKFGDRAVLRTLHFFDEDKRAEDEKNALARGNFDEFLRLINESGNSSYKFLQNVYSNFSPREQGVSLAIALTEEFIKKNCNGAVRVHGGGFAGTIQCFIPSDMLEGYKKYIEKFFGNGSCYILKIRAIGGCEIA